MDVDPNAGSIQCLAVYVYASTIVVDDVHQELKIDISPRGTTLRHQEHDTLQVSRMTVAQKSFGEKQYGGCRRRLSTNMFPWTML
jgi:hypothetical protein